MCSTGRRGLPVDPAGRPDRPRLHGVRTPAPITPAQQRADRTGHPRAGQPGLPGLRPGRREGPRPARLHPGPVHAAVRRRAGGRLHRDAHRPGRQRHRLHLRPARRRDRPDGPLHPDDRPGPAHRPGRRLQRHDPGALHLPGRPPGHPAGGAPPGRPRPRAHRPGPRPEAVRAGAAQDRGLPPGHDEERGRPRSSTAWPPSREARRRPAPCSTGAAPPSSAPAT